MQQQLQFKDQLDHHARHVVRYDDWELQEKARSVIPVDRLHEQATARQVKEPELSFQDLVLKELLHWFKFEFFKWVNEAPCERSCSAKTAFKGMAQPTSHELKYGAGRVELYECTQCHSLNRFPRFGDPWILLDEPNRRGRCGEWANVFTLCCKAMGYDARHVVDWTDHVWTEVYSDHLNRWVHLDSCEAAWDTPLVYEAGWGKKLTYVIAFSADEVVDVTRRYTRDFNQILTRRTIVPEQWLQQQIMIINAQKRDKDSPEKIIYILDRTEREEQEMTQSSNRQVKADETTVRQSGSVAWRTSRGEMGLQTSSGTGEHSHMTLLPELGEPIVSFASVLTNEDQRLIQLNGLAFVQGPTQQRKHSSLILTPARNDCRGSAWLKTPFSTKQSMAIEFAFRMRPGTQPGADGFAFVIQNDEKAVAALGEGGAGLGYQGLKCALAIEFDTYQTADRTADPDSNHISIQTVKGIAPLSAHHAQSAACSPSNSLPQLNDGSFYYCLVLYDNVAKTLSVSLSDEAETQVDSKLKGKNYTTLLRLDQFDMSAVLMYGHPTPQGKQGGVDTAFFGFTAATGGLNQSHEIEHFAVWKASWKQ